MTIFKLPDLGEGLPDAEIVNWHVKEGDHVHLDQTLVSMETAKAVVEVPSPFAGQIKKLYGVIGDVIKTGSPLIEFESDQSEKKASETGATVAGKIEVGNTILNESPTGIQSTTKGNTLKATPMVRALAQKLNVDLANVQATGPNNTITQQDVENYAHALQSVGPLELLKGTRRFMSQAMSQSHVQVVPVTVMEDAKLFQWQNKQDLTVRLIQAVVKAVKIEPALNAWFDGKAQGRRLIPHVNIGIAVDTQEGLFVPVLREAEKQDTETLRKEIDRLKKQVQDRSILPQDLQGASITLSNFGKFTGRYANPIVVPPMVAILGAGKIREEPVVINQEIKISKILPLALTFDHRAVTGGEASRFLGAIIEALEKSE